MKKKTKIIVSLAVACAGALTLGACAAYSPYPELAEQGFTVSVRYDLNGGMALLNENVSIVDTYHLEDVEKGVKLLPPDDSRRPTATPVNVERTGYFLAGWYQVREPRVDGEGRPLDDEGNLCHVPVEVKDEDGNLMYDSDGNVLTQLVSDGGKAQGYAYDLPWDFEKDVFGGAGFSAEAEEGEAALTLYAAWVPFYSYRLMGEVKAEDGTTSWVPFATYSYNPADPDAAEDSELPLPAWNETTGAMEYGKLALGVQYKKTFSAAYLDPEKTQRASKLENKGSWDKETAIASDPVAVYYADWTDGVWYHISNEAQFVANADVGGCMEIRADLDFGKTDENGKPLYAWPAAYSSGTFTGTLKGNGHTIKGVSVVQSNAQDGRGGLFGEISKDAVIENVVFEDVSFTLATATRTTGSYFGLFAGMLERGATLSGVSVTGTLTIGAEIYVPSPLFDPDTGTFGEPPHVYDVGLFSGNLETGGAEYDVKWKNESDYNVTVDATGRVNLG